MATKTKRLSEMRPGDRVWFEGEIVTVVSIERGSGDAYRVKTTAYEFEDCWSDGNWAVPEDGEE